MSSEHILTTIQDRVATLTFNHPAQMNAWGPALEAALRDAIAVCAANDEVRAIVLTGAGRAFCVGAEMGRLASNSSASQPAAAAVVPETGTGNFDQRYSYLLDVPKPIIAAINGPVAGVGLCIALYCDLRYMAAGNKMSTSFARRGLVAEHGSAWMLSRLIGPMNAADLLLSARTITAEDAAQMGLVRVLPQDGFLAGVQAIASDLANLSSPRSMGIIKRQLNLAPFQSLAEATKLADDEIAKCRGTEDFKEGVAHFVEKRRPAFTGR
ncbi:enoyl-CoA hydratase-related protein [Rhodopseudomonas palustris]|uniref:Enoyl-CoA hydratase n=1 Tax=Rhodopseudomonas palustris TaxID=1076 RepID=A0A418V1M1_RHOPL|nr:enoyl-CoA hydratase-related protein [Rhodopseudomonas palustris]RJF69771.1 enoyl-CoA hydratase [Rhodopseudomonas palustris]